MFPTVRIAHADHRCVQRDTAFLDPGDLDLALLIERHHNLVGEPALLHGAQQSTGTQPRAGLDPRDEGPLLVEVQRCQVCAAREEGSMLDGDAFQRVLETVIHLTQQPRTEHHRQHLATLPHRVAHRDPAGVLEHLRIGEVATHPQYLGLEPFPAPLRTGAPGFDIDHFIFLQRQLAAVFPARLDGH